MATSTPPQSVTPAKRKFCEVPMVTLIVGEIKKPFYVQLDLLCDASPFFKAAFTGNFKESSAKMMQLPEDKESTFELFVDWLYYQRYEMLPEVEDPDDVDEEEENDEDDEDDENDVDDDRFLQAFRLFVFADKYMVYKLKVLVIETIFAERLVCAWSPSNASIAYAYKHTTQGSGLRKLLADGHAWNIIPKWYEHPQAQKFLRRQSDFATDVILSFAKNIERGSTYNAFDRDMPEEYTV